jgi:hypothetical protein
MPPVRIVFAAVNVGAVTEDGAAVTLVQGEPWAADDPFVKFHPDLFSSNPPAPRYPRRTVAVEAGRG